MQFELKTINESGIQEIRVFLCARHKRGEEFTKENLYGWAADAEFQLGEGNPPTIEIKSWDSVSGHTEEYTVSSSGVSVQMMNSD